MKLVITRKAMPKAISDVVAGTCFLTQLTKRTGTVFSDRDTAEAAPVSSTHLVNVSIAPLITEYFVRGKIIRLNMLNGLLPRLLAVSSISEEIPSRAADID